MANLEKAYETEGRQLIRDFEKNIVLAMIDDAWKDHLRDMDDLRQSVRTAQYEQKDPLLIYKFEAFNLFGEMIDKNNKEIVSFLFKGQLPGQDTEVKQAQGRERTNYEEMQTSHPELVTSGGGSAEQQGQRPKPKPVVSDKSYGRNDLVTVQNLSTGEKKELKFKKAQPLVSSKQWMIVD